jgi:hypothetical protein
MPQGGPAPAHAAMPPHGGAGGAHVAVGQHGYRFDRPGDRREITAFSPRERAAWDRGHWRHAEHYGRDGWWWEVNGIWYWYPERLEGPPEYVSEYLGDDDYGYPPEAVAGYPPPPPDYDDYPPPPPPPPNPVAGGAVGGAILGGLLGGAITGRAGGAAAGAIIGGVTGAAIGADAERRRGGYWWWHGACYYRYPNGEYAPVAPGYCSY